MNRTLLLDGDIFIYRAASANEIPTQWSDWLWTLHADLDASIEQLDRQVAELKDELNADRVVFALTDVVNWRKSVYQDYKLNRAKTRKPVVYQPMREYVAEVYETFQRPSLEGDDVLGILATSQRIKGEKIIVSLDKDMRSIPGLLLNDGKARKRIADDPSLTLEDCIETVTEAEADRHHLFQTLTGDTSDGYPGCPKVGPVTANKILDAVIESCTPWADDATRRREMWRAVVATYEKQGLSEEVALTNARVARICRVTDYDFRKGKVLLWNPHFNSLAPSPSL